MWKKIKTDGETRNDGDFKQLEREVRLNKIIILFHLQLNAQNNVFL